MDGWLSAAPVAPPLETARPVQVTVLLPTYNEELAIRRVLEEIVECMTAANPAALQDGPAADRPTDGIPWSQRVAAQPGGTVEFEILIVDDGSTDRTVEIAEQFALDCWQCTLHVIRCIENRGAGAARKVGVRAARGEIIVMLDADGTYPAAGIRQLLRHFPAYDQVNGARTSEQGTLPWLRVPAKWCIRKLACYLTGYPIPDLNTGLKAFKREAMLPWLWVVPDGFSCVTTMTLAFLTNGYSVKYVPTEYRPRIGQSKFHPIKDTLAYLSTVIRIVLYFRPLKVFLPLAGLLLGGGVAKSLYSFVATGRIQESDIVV
ncbi:MAG: glycosyltransferase family 2 protein, partial [Pirellulales bacterium]